ncbi:hypothetical protein FE257_000810 [Aspergillus nanangensis]|uniref:Type 1 phosphatases regulator n=1 Tax=Aspergillus nanangensis TaxID=2582783 RepID=A0AAD4CG07_ASPNN|nr:hypothetical protein FE257_000810 [Aspergillus nanangensis]
MSRVRNEASGSGTTSRIESVSPQRSGNPRNVSGTLRLRAENEPAAASDLEDVSARRIRWSEDVIDNEGMGKKSSKVCCIYHKTRPVGESSSESESSDSSSSDSDSDSDPGNSNDGREHSVTHRHNGTQRHTHNTRRGRSECSHNSTGRKGKRRKPSPNAYEKMPKTAKER